MQVILLENIRNLGKLGDTVNVKAGFARNFLLPKAKVVQATTANLAKFEARRADLEAQAAAKLAEAEQRALPFAELTVTLTRKAAEEGKLYGAIGIYDVVHALEAEGIQVEKRELNMPEGAIRHVGEYEIGVSLHSDVTTQFNLVVNPE